MASATKIKQDAVQTLTITLASLAAAAARQGDMLTNTDSRPAALVFVKITSGGSAPAATEVYSVYLIRRDDASSPSITDDNAGGSDAVITILGSPLLGVVPLSASTNTAFYAVFDTGLLGPLGSAWTIAVKNTSGQTLHATGGNHAIKYRYYYYEAQ